MRYVNDNAEEWSPQAGRVSLAAFAQVAALGFVWINNCAILL